MKEINITIEISVNKREARVCREINYTNQLSHFCGLREISQITNNK